MPDLPLTIPEIDHDRLIALAAKVRPVKLALAFIVPPAGLRGESFLWDPRFAEVAPDLEPIITVRTLHTYGYHGFFKPTVAEVLAQMPPGIEDIAVAFKVDGPKDAADLARESEALNAGFHVARTTFYRRASNG